MNWLKELIARGANIGGKSIRQLAKELTDSDQNVRRHAAREMISAIKNNSNESKIKRSAQSLNKLLKAVEPNIEIALTYKKQLSSSSMWLHLYSRSSPNIVREPVFQDLDKTLNALEWLKQTTSTVCVECNRCHKDITAVTSIASATCPACGETVFLARWLYDSSGNPIAFLDGEFVYGKVGEYLGNLEGNEIWTDDYEGEIVLDDRLYVNLNKSGWRRNGYHDPTSYPDTPLLQKPKNPVDPSRKPGSDGEFYMYIDHRSAKKMT